MRQLLLCAVFAVTFLIAGCDAGGSSMPVEDDPGPPPGENPNTSASIEITAEADGEVVNLQWSGSNLDQAARYRLYRAQTASFDTAGTFHASTADQEYVDTDVETKKTYFYRVAAVDAAGTALALSNADGASPIDETPPAPPTGITGAGGFYRATLGWEASASDDLDGYHVYRSTRQFTDISDAKRLTASLVDTTGFTDNAALDGERYIYRVTAVDGSGNESALSEEIAITPTFNGDAFRGEELFAANCSACHISANAWDLQAFAMPDTMIHRRAIAHISEQEAFDIIEFVHSGDVRPFHDASTGKKELPPFQPGDRILSSDRAFAMNLFGQDQWPEDLTPRDLLGLDPATLPLPFPLPDWNVEGDESDWLPSQPLPSRIADQSNVQSALRAYRTNGSDENFLEVYKAIHDVDRGFKDHNPSAPEVSPQEVAEVYELNRWISSLVATHVLRKNGDEIEEFRRLMDSEFRPDLMRGQGWHVKGLHHSLVTEIWNVGDIMRMHGPDSNIRMPEMYGTGNREIKFSTIRWFYLSWMVRPEGESSFAILYFPRLLTTAGYPRVAAFFAAHMVVNGKLGFQKVYDVLVDYPYSVGEKWIPNFTRFIVDAYVDRIERGDFARGDTHHQRNHFSKGINRVINSDKYVTEEEKDYLREKRDFILNWLKEQENSSE